MERSHKCFTAVKNAELANWLWTDDKKIVCFSGRFVKQLRMILKIGANIRILIILYRNINTDLNNTEPNARPHSICIKVFFSILALLRRNYLHLNFWSYL